MAYGFKRRNVLSRRWVGLTALCMASIIASAMPLSAQVVSNLPDLSMQGVAIGGQPVPIATNGWPGSTAPIADPSVLPAGLVNGQSAFSSSVASAGQPAPVVPTSASPNQMCSYQSCPNCPNAPCAGSPSAPCAPPPCCPGPPACNYDPNGLMGPTNDNWPICAGYKYNGGGGYLHVATPDEEFTLNLQNQVTADGTFYSIANPPTAENGFNIPFTRTYLTGNATSNWQYQVATQAFLGQFNLLDCFVNYKQSDAFNVRFGRGLSPFLYEYYGFSPAWEPVITNSLMFQLAGKRQEGVMFWGNTLGNRLQYQAGVFNGNPGSFYSLDKNVAFLGSATLMPFAKSGGIADDMGFGGGVMTGQQNYALNQPTAAQFINGAGEPTTNINYITSTGIQFFSYDAGTLANGNMTRVAPHFFWFGHPLSVLTEYVYSHRELTLGGYTGAADQQGFYVNTSYFLTGEAYKCNGLGGYTTISPLRPFNPHRGQRGPGAWELAFQYSELALANNNFNFTTTPNLYASRCDQMMWGINWWPNKYTRLSIDEVLTQFNKAIPVGSNAAVDQYTITWVRAAMFF